MAKKAAAIPPPTSPLDMPLSLIEQELARRRKKGIATETLEEMPERINLREFLPDAWGVVEGEARPFKPNWHLDAVCDLLQAVADGHIEKAIIMEPPSHAKSLVTSVIWPAWDWGPNNRPNRRYLCTSYGGDTESPANRDAGRMRDLITSPWYQRGWGTRFSLDSTQNAKSYFQNNHRGYRVSVGLDGAIPGWRADIILIDDPTKPPDGTTEPSYADITHAEHIWESTLRTRAWDEGSAVVLIMHRLHEDDLAGYFTRQGGWEVLRLPGLATPTMRSRIVLHNGYVIEDPRTVEDEPLHPGLVKAVEDMRLRAKTQPWIHAAQDQQIPAPLEGGMWKDSWNQHWEVGIPGEDRLPQWLPFHWDDMIITVDCAFKDSEDNSWVVMQVWGRRHANAYLLDQVREHWDMPGTVKGLIELCQKWPMAQAKYVEDKANGPGVVALLKGRVPGLMSTSDDDGVLATGKNKTATKSYRCLKNFCMGSKEAKFQSILIYGAAHQVYFPPKDSIGWWPDFVKEITQFPRSSHNDQVDAMSMGVWKLLNSFEVRLDAGELVSMGAEDHAGMLVVADAAFGSATVGKPTPQQSPRSSAFGDLTFGGGLGIGGNDLERAAFGRR